MLPWDHTKRRKIFLYTPRTKETLVKLANVWTKSIARMATNPMWVKPTGLSVLDLMNIRKKQNKLPNGNTLVLQEKIHWMKFTNLLFRIMSLNWGKQRSSIRTQINKQDEYGKQYGSGSGGGGKHRSSTATRTLFSKSCVWSATSSQNIEIWRWE